MKVFDTANIRNVALVGHGQSGKTTLTAALLHACGATESLGSVPDGTAPTDFDEDEIERKFSMGLGVGACAWRDQKLNLIDAPGHASFVGDAAAAIRAADAVLIVVHGVDGIGVVTQKMWDQAEQVGIPVLFAVTQLDRDRASFNGVVEALVGRFGRHVVPLSLPLGTGAPSAVGRLVSGKKYAPAAGGGVDVSDPDGDDAARIAADQEKLFDMVAESDDSLMEAFLEQGALNADQLTTGLRKAIAGRALFPVFALSATEGVGIHPLLDAIVDFGPSPADRTSVPARNAEGEKIELAIDKDGPLVVQVVKTYIDAFAGRISVLRLFSGTARLDQAAWNADTSSAEKLSNLSVPLGKNGEKIGEAHAGDIVSVTKLKETLTGHTLVADKGHVVTLPPIPFPNPVIAYAVKAADAKSEEKVSSSLNRLAEEDATLRIERDRRSHELMISGLGNSHVRMTLEKMARRYGVAATLEKPKVPYLETITKSAKSSYRHKKQSGGAGQFAEVHMRIEPLPRGGGFEYDSEVFGGSISRNFWPSIEKGVKQVMDHGAIAGYPMIDVKAVIFDGKEHPVDSKDIAFQIAGRNVFRDAVQKAGPVVLEPVMKVSVTCPDECMGDVLGDLNKRRGRVLGSESRPGGAHIDAEVPMAEMLEYAATLRSLTSGAGDYSMELDHYERVPADVQKALAAEFHPHDAEE